MSTRGQAVGVAALVAVLFLVVLSPGSAAAKRRRAHSFLGVVPQAPVGAGEWARLGRAGLGIRMVFDWGALEPRPGEYEFGALDETLTAAATQGVRVLPVVGGAPPWVGGGTARWMPPLGKAKLRAWRKFLRRLVGRYGPGGRFWRGASRAEPIRRWQVWNEPNYPLFWSGPPSPEAYVRLLRASAAAIRGVDPRAKIVAAGLAPISGEPPPWEFLRQMYRVPGAKRAFDVVALHPYTNTAARVETEVELTRAVMTAAGDRRTPLLISEIGLASSRGPSPYDRGRRGQARFLSRALGRLAAGRRRWHIGGVYWYSLRDGGHDPYCVFCQRSGLLRADGRPKPSWFALRRLAARLR